MSQSDARAKILAFLAGMVLLFAALIGFARYPQLFRRGKEYQAYFHNVAGLNVGDEVRYGGLSVGSVTRMELDAVDPTRILVEFRVRRRTPVRRDTRAAISQVGLLGEPYLHLTPGRRLGSPELAPGNTLLSDDNQSFQEAMNQLARFFESTDTLFSGLDRLSQSNPFERLDRTLSRVEILVGTTAEGSSRVLTQLDQASAQLNRVLTQAERVVAVLDTTITTARPEFSQTQAEALGALRELRVLVADLRVAMQQGGGVDQLMRNVTTTSENLARLSARLERDPTSVLKQRRPPAKTAGPTVKE